MTTRFAPASLGLHAEVPVVGLGVRRIGVPDEQRLGKAIVARHVALIEVPAAAGHLANAVQVAVVQAHVERRVAVHVGEAVARERPLRTHRRSCPPSTGTDWTGARNSRCCSSACRRRAWRHRPHDRRSHSSLPRFSTCGSSMLHVARFSGYFTRLKSYRRFAWLKPRLQMRS